MFTVVFWEDDKRTGRHMKKRKRKIFQEEMMLKMRLAMEWAFHCVVMGKWQVAKAACEQGQGRVAMLKK